MLDPARCAGRDPVACAEAALRGGATLVQLRDKVSSTRDLVALVRRLRPVLASAGVPLIVNDRIDVALAAEADGCHVGATDMPPVDARRLLSAHAILGVTIHHAHEASAADVADYAGVGPLFATTSKDPGDLPLGSGGLRRLLAALRQRHPGLPACAIAGIDASNAAATIEAGADGVAVIAAIFMANDIRGAARELRDAVDGALTVRRSA